MIIQRSLTEYHLCIYRYVGVKFIGPTHLYSAAIGTDSQSVRAVHNAPNREHTTAVSPAAIILPRSQMKMYIMVAFPFFFLLHKYIMRLLQ
jgi:hypothetical protein